MAYSSDIDFVQHDLRSSDWIGVVINSNDPTFSGRCQVKVFGLFDGIQNEHLLEYSLITEICMPQNTQLFKT